MNNMQENKEEVCLSVGDKVPNFNFQVFQNGKISESSFDKYRGQWIVLFFYPADFTFVCPTELGELASLYPEFKKEKAEILSVSTDTAFAHKMWHQTSDTIKQIEFPMVSDHRHELVHAFNTFCAADGLAYRGTFIVDPDGIIRGADINDNSIGRSGSDLLRKLRAAKHVNENPGQVCPASWNPGSDTLKPSDDLVGKI